MKRFIAFLLTAVMLFALSVCAFAAEAQYTLHMDRNGKTLLDADGNAVSGAVKDKAVAEFYSLMNGVNINWMDFNYDEFEVKVDDSGNVALGKQTLSLLDGTFRTSSDAEVGLFVKPDRYQASGDGEVTFAVVDFDGTEIGSADATTEFDDCGRRVFNCLCINCEENQDDNLHMMVCGHYSCEAGDVGHKAGECGTPGHMNCDGNCHDLCTNCQEPLCSGMHGVGVCEHVHKWIISPVWAYCETCGKAEYNEKIAVNLIP